MEDTLEQFWIETVLDLQGMLLRNKNKLHIHAQLICKGNFFSTMHYNIIFRYYVTKDNIMYMASEVGVVNVAPENVIQKVSFFQIRNSMAQVK